MSDVVVVVKNDVETFNEGSHEYAQAMYDRAFDLWCATGRNGSRVERLLLKWATENTLDGGEIPPVPAAKTINSWARDDDWETLSLRKLIEDLPKEGLRLRTDAMRLAAAAIQDLFDIKTGKFDADPALVNVKSRDAHETLKMFGLGTFGANQGGEFIVQVSEILAALGMGGQDAGGETDPKKKSRENREAIAGKKRGKD